ncbi:hypothetical protein F5879DRAFT_924400 [Lentinula edodes]|nr:hypothetical protein F5879DRAFT_924400 [Lentinula edodes]
MVQKESASLFGPVWCRGNLSAYLDSYGAEGIHELIWTHMVQSGAQGCRRNPQAYLDLYGAEWCTRVQKESASLFGPVWCRAVHKGAEGIHKFIWTRMVQRESVSLFVVQRESTGLFAPIWCRAVHKGAERIRQLNIVVQSGAQGCRRNPQAYLDSYGAERCTRVQSKHLHTRLSQDLVTWKAKTTDVVPSKNT